MLQPISIIRTNFRTSNYYLCLWNCPQYKARAERKGCCDALREDGLFFPWPEWIRNVIGEGSIPFMWTDRYHLKMLMEQQLRTARWVSQVVKNKRGNNTGPLTRDSNLLIGGKPKPKPSAPLQRGLPARSVVRYLVRSHPAPPPPRRHLRGPDPSHFDPWWDRSRPPGTWQLGSSHLPLFVWRDQAGADRQSDSGRCLTAVCMCASESRNLRLADVSLWDFG